MAPFGSGHTKIVAGVAERYGIPVIASVASSESVYDQGFKNLFGTLAPELRARRRDADAVHEGAADAQEGRDPRPRRRVSARHGGDLRVRAPGAGLEVVYAEFYSIGTIDHSAALSKIKGLAPDWIYVTGYSQDLILARKQMHDLGLTAPIVTMITGPAYREFIDGLGPLAEGVTSVSWWHHTTTYKSDDVWGSTQAFYEDFKARENRPTPTTSMPPRRQRSSRCRRPSRTPARSSRARSATRLRTLDIITFYGPIMFGEHGMNAARDLPILQVQGQAVKVLFPASIAQAKLVLLK